MHNSKEDSVKLKLGQPEHGWLLMDFSFKEYNLSIDISDVPNNPIEELREAISTLSQSTSTQTEVLFHLEPNCFYFELKKNKDQIELNITFSRDYKSKREFKKQIIGSYNQIVLPLYRGIKSFYSFNYKEPHWPQTSEKLVQKLKETVKEKSA